MDTAAAALRPLTIDDLPKDEVGYLADPDARTITAFGQSPLPLAEEAIFPR